MKTKKNKTITPRAVLATVLGAALLIGCATVASPRSPHGSSQAGPNGAELWAQTCNRCHNFRSPSSHTDARWDLVMMHMRARANLTGAEARAILEYLKSAN